MNYLFVPFGSNESNSELLSMGTLWASNAAKDPRGKEAPKLLFYNIKAAKPLSIIGNNDTVYILAHGYAASPDYIFNLANFPAMGMSPNELGIRLKVAGLGAGHRKIKLYICNSSGAFQTFATEFKRIMRDNLGFANIDIYYYNCSVSVPKEFSDGLYHKDGVLENAMGNIVLTPRFRASENRQRVP
ncbi:hypothetical protein DLD99_17225 [Pseudomonas kribbensis]|uniref:Uncharacterized protein n=1 Tax=Pseudomonas kribbensis TaxID=1628086 RepID=A0A345RS72_9PSED|nr:hypothetical protein [Pseudomonas kribbensis]AXI62138.1 hypothetical protein DLD99_17225 [Pseudomonas kribbensis]